MYDVLDYVREYVTLVGFTLIQMSKRIPCFFTQCTVVTFVPEIHHINFGVEMCPSTHLAMSEVVVLYPLVCLNVSCRLSRT